jgi:hypothetical protein
MSLALSWCRSSKTTRTLSLQNADLGGHSKPSHPAAALAKALLPLMAAQGDGARTQRWRTDQHAVQTASGCSDGIWSWHNIY